MMCKDCGKTDGMIYMSNPPKIKCEVTGQFHFLNEECNVETATIESKCDMHLGVECIICGESIELTENENIALMYGKTVGPKVCDKCKEAIMNVRYLLEKYTNGNI